MTSRQLASRIVASVLIAAASACALSQRGLQPTAEAFERGLSCHEAMGVARRTVLRLGYMVDVTENPTGDKPGRVVGRRETGWELSNPQDNVDYPVEVLVYCDDEGSRLKLFTAESVFGRKRLALTFGETVAAVADQPLKRPQIAERPATGLVINMTPLRSRNSLSELGVDLPALGITPVKIEIENRSGRAYRFETKRVRMVSEGGDRARPLSIDRAISGNAAVKAHEKLIENRTIAPGARLDGFLYFPAAAYRRARVVLIDEATDEPEGFAVEF